MQVKVKPNRNVTIDHFSCVIFSETENHLKREDEMNEAGPRWRMSVTSWRKGALTVSNTLKLIRHWRA